MKKNIIFMALILMVSATFNQVKAQDPIVTRSDSISYSAGMSFTQGLLPFLVQSGVDTTYMDEFVRGFQEYIKKADDPKFKAFAAGYNIANQVKDRMLPDVSGRFEGTIDTIEPEVFYRGFVDGVNKDTTVFKSIDGAGAFYKVSLNEDIEEKNERLYGPNREAGRRFLAENANDTSVVVLPSGLQYRVLTAGTGYIPKATETVKVHYEGRLVDGTVFDSSRRHGDQPASFRANQVIKGWTEALTRMPVGSKWQLYIPYELAYGDKEQGQIKPYSMLIFDVELIDIAERPKVAPVTTPTAPKKEVKKPATTKKEEKKPAKKKKK